MPLLAVPNRNDVAIKTLKGFSRTLCVPLDELLELAHSFKQQYKPFLKKTGSKVRRIDNPREKLKSVQRRINSIILNKVKLPSAIKGGIKGCSSLEHPRLHIKASVVITIDVKNCFPGISYKKIYGIWQEGLGFSPEVARLATMLTSFEGHLPQGSPTSGMLANIALYPCVKRIIPIAKKHRLRQPTQYVDDMAISGKSLDKEFITKIISEFSREGFRINRNKIEVMRRGKPQIITKKVVNKKVAALSKTRNNIRSALKELENTSVDHPAYAKLYNSLVGRVYNLKKMHPFFVEKQLKKIKLIEKPLKEIKER